MAERRMFSKSVVDSDAFIEMPLSAQALYFHLAMRADDDGFVNNHNRIRNDIGAAADDLKLLLAKRFVIGFDSGVIVIKHWRIHNYIQKDRYKPTTHTKELALLTVCENKAYTECIHDVSNLDTQVRLEVEIEKEIELLPQQLQQSLTMARERAREKEGEQLSEPAMLEVAVYLRDEFDLSMTQSAHEAEKFIAWNALRGWDCLPHWKLAADLWVARMEERE